MSENDIGFDTSSDVPLGDIADDEKEVMMDSVKGSIEKEQMRKKVRADMGMTDTPKPAESIPPELPKMMFKIGAKIIGCDRFNLDPEEAKTFAKHASIIIGPVNSKIYSIFMVTIILLSKVNDCWNKAKDLLKGKKGEKKEDKFDEATESTIPVFGDGT